MNKELYEKLLRLSVINTCIVDKSLNLPEDFIGVLEQEQADLNVDIENYKEFYNLQVKLLAEWKAAYENK